MPRAYEADDLDGGHVLDVVHSDFERRFLEQRLAARA
jgi:hypothetical protein